MNIDFKILKRIRWNNVFKLLGSIFLVVLLFHLFVNWLPAIFNQPQDILVTNVTSSSATISWITPTPTKGKVYYSENQVFSGPFSSWNSKIAFDDRDNQTAYEECLKQFTKNSSKNASKDLEVEVNDSVCTKYEVKKLGKYYTHHVTIQNLDEYMKYNFAVGDGNWGWKAEFLSFITFSEKDSVTAPRPIFGKIVDSENNVSSDSIIYVRFFEGDRNMESILYSSITNDKGGWYIDGSNIYNIDGVPMDLRISNDHFEAFAQMENFVPSNVYNWIYGVFDGAYPDIIVENNEVENNIFSFIFKSYAREVISDDEYDRRTTPPVKAGETGRTGNEAKKVEKLNRASNNNHHPIIEADSQTQALLLAEEEQYQQEQAAAIEKENQEKAKEEEKKNQCTYSNQSGCDSIDELKENMNDVGAGNAIEIASNLPECVDANNPLECATNALNLNDRTTYEVLGLPLPPSPSTDDDENPIIPPMVYNSEEDSWSCLGTLLENGVCVPKVETYVCPFINVTVTNLSSCPSEEVAEDFVLKTPPEEAEEVIKWGSTFTPNLPDEDDPIKKDPIPAYCANDLVLPGCPGYIDPNNKENLVGNLEFNSYGTVVVEIDGEYYSPSDLGLTRSDLEEKGKICENSTNGCPVIIEEMNVVDIIKDNCDEFKDNLASNDAFRKMVVDYRDGIYENINNIPEEAEGVDIVTSDQVDGYYETAWQNLISFHDPNDMNELASIEDKLQKENPGIDYKWIKDDGELFPRLIYINNQTELGMIETIDEVLPDDDTSQTLKELDDKKSNLVSAGEESETNKIIFFPEFGMYNVEIDGFEINNLVVDDNTIVIYYLEVNGISGIQPPVDKENPQPGEDIIIDSEIFEINYSKEASNREINLKKGLNIISFNYLPAPLTDDSSFTAKSLIKLSQNNGVRIEYITFFEGGRWVDGIKCNESECFGEDFVIAPGRGYLIKSEKKGSFLVPMFDLLDPIPLPLSIGWNLIGIHGYTDTFTARSFIDSVNSIDKIQADNVTNYSTAKSKYEGLQVVDDMEYGFDFELDPNIGYFVRINKFEPENADCKSIIWHPDGKLNGKCGNIRNLFNL